MCLHPQELLMMEARNRNDEAEMGSSRSENE